MLYFSNVGVDPDRIDLAQMDKLKSFKEKTYPNGLVEHFRTQIEFKDKLAKQLEIKIRDLQRNDSSGVAPLSLELISDAGEILCDSVNYTVTKPVVRQDDKQDDKLDKLDKLEKAGRISKIITLAIRRQLTVPLAMLINNPSSSGIRNIFVSLNISSDKTQVHVTQFLERGVELLGNVHAWSVSFAGKREDELPAFSALREKVREFDTGKLQRVGDCWSLSCEWESLQPQRKRLIEPILYIQVEESTKLNIEAKIFSDSFSEPLLLKAEAHIQVVEKQVDLEELIPDWEERVPKGHSCEEGHTIEAESDENCSEEEATKSNARSHLVEGPNWVIFAFRASRRASPLILEDRSRRPSTLEGEAYLFELIERAALRRGADPHEAAGRLLDALTYVT